VRMCATAGMAHLRPRRLARENVCHRGEGAAPAAKVTLMVSPKKLFLALVE